MIILPDIFANALTLFKAHNVTWLSCRHRCIMARTSLIFASIHRWIDISRSETCSDTSYKHRWISQGSTIYQNTMNANITTSICAMLNVILTQKQKGRATYINRWSRRCRDISAWHEGFAICSCWLWLLLLVHWQSGGTLPLTLSLLTALKQRQP